jgi:hypothetical protein
MSVARNILKNPKLLPGGGATELTVSATLKQKSSSIEGIEKVSGRLLCCWSLSCKSKSEVLLRTIIFMIL